MSGSRFSIELFDDHAQIGRSDSKLRKPVSFQDLVNIVGEVSQQTMSYSRSENVRLPTGTYLTVYAGNRLNICTYHPQHEAVLTHRQKKFKITLPNIVVHHVLQVSNNGAKHEVKDTFYYCTPCDVNNLPNVIPSRVPKVFGWVPFPNFYENFRMCFGGNSLLHVVEGGDLRMLNMFYDVIEGSPFNDDLSLYGVNYTRDKREWFEYLAKCHEEGKGFPYDQLSL